MTLKTLRPGGDTAPVSLLAVIGWSPGPALRQASDSYTTRPDTIIAATRGSCVTMRAISGSALAAEDVEQQIAMTVVIAVEEPRFRAD